MKKRFSAKTYGSLALALAAFAVAGTAPVFAQSSGAWSAGISARVVRRTCIRSRPTSAAMVPTRKFPRPSDIQSDSTAQRRRSPSLQALGVSAFRAGMVCTCVVDHHSGYNAYAMILDRAAAVPSSLRRVDWFGEASQR